MLEEVIYSTHDSNMPHFTAQYPHSRHIELSRSYHSKSIAKNVLSFISQIFRIVSGSPKRTRALVADKTVAGNVACNFLYSWILPMRRNGLCPIS